MLSVMIESLENNVNLGKGNQDNLETANNLEAQVWQAADKVFLWQQSDIDALLMRIASIKASIICIQAPQEEIEISEAISPLFEDDLVVLAVSVDSLESRIARGIMANESGETADLLEKQILTMLLQIEDEDDQASSKKTLNNLDERIKDIKAMILKKENSSEPSLLTSLPSEMLNQVCIYLDVRDLGRMASVSQGVQEAVEVNSIWMKFLEKEGYRKAEAGKCAKTVYQQESSWQADGVPLGFKLVDENKVITVKVNLKARWVQVRKHIAKLKGVPLDRVKLVIAGRSADDDRIVAADEPWKQAIIHVICDPS